MTFRVTDGTAEGVLCAKGSSQYGAILSMVTFRPVGGTAEGSDNYDDDNIQLQSTPVFKL